MGRLTAANAATTLTAAPQEKAPKADAVLNKKVRLSVDIEPDPYRSLVSWCQDIAFNLGRARINHVWVLRAVIDEMLVDKGLQARVVNRVSDMLEELDRLKRK